MSDCTYNSQIFELNESTEKEKDNDSNTSENEDEPELLWSIDDDTLFHPLGLVNHGSTDGRSVFVVWSEDYLLNFVFKKSARTQRSKMSKVRLSLSTADEEQIIDLLILELNTLLLMSSGSVYYFSSMRAAHSVPWLSGVRCMSEARSGFSVIRLHTDATLCLEVYRDVEQLGKNASTLLLRFDITYDELNLFNCSWRDERFTLLAQSVPLDHVNFLEELCGQDFELKDVEELYLFTVSGSVFVLIPEKAEVKSPDSSSSNNTPAYHIQLLSTYATNIEFLKILLPQRLCLVFLSCGSIDIWFNSHIAGALQRKTHHTGSVYTHYTFDTTNACFYYTDASQVAQVEFKYDSASDTVLVQQMHKPIAGMIALTWVKSIQQIIALSWNNIFYQLIFEKNDTSNSLAAATTIDYENPAELSVLTSRKLGALLAKAQAAQELFDLPQQLHAEIEHQFQQQQLIGLASKTHLYKSLFDASLEYSLQLPTIQQQETLLLYTQSNMLLQDNSLFALIFLKISINYVFQASLWNLHIVDMQTGQMHILNIPPTLLHHNLCIVLPATYKQQQLLPVYQLKLLTFVAFESDFLAITLCFDLKSTPRTYANLFNVSTSRLSMCSTLSLDDLIADFNKSPKDVAIPPTISHILKLNRDCTYDSILEVFNTSRLVLEDLDELKLHFMSAQLKLTFITAADSNNFLKLESMDAVALYYTKLYLFINLKLAPLAEEQQHIVMQHQCEIERCYGTLMAENDNEHIVASTALHLEHLKRIYTKMRNDFGQLLQN